MIIVDTSVWIDHFRQKNNNLESLLYRGTVQIHEFIIGELAIGNFKNRKPILDLFESAPKLKKITHDEFMFLLINILYMDVELVLLIYIYWLLLKWQM